MTIQNNNIVAYMYEKIKLQERTTICQTREKQSQTQIVWNIQLALEKRKKKKNNYFSNTWKKQVPNIVFDNNNFKYQSIATQPKA
jgi:hypothetical protein